MFEACPESDGKQALRAFVVLEDGLEEVVVDAEYVAEFVFADAGAGEVGYVEDGLGDEGAAVDGLEVGEDVGDAGVYVAAGEEERIGGGVGGPFGDDVEDELGVEGHEVGGGEEASYGCVLDAC